MTRTLLFCRLCESGSLSRVRAFGEVPLANDLRPFPRREPLTLLRCFQCGLLQLKEVVPDEALFPANYAYQSGASAMNKEGFAALAHNIAERVRLSAYQAVLDIGCNDGSLLDAFLPYTKHTFGADPAAPKEHGAHVFFQGPWGEESWNALGRQEFQVITATNVWAHLDDLHAATALVKRALAPQGLFVVQAPWVRDLLQQCYYDTIYHEHRSYLGLAQMQRLCAEHGLVVHDVSYVPELHGGSLRYVIAHAPLSVSANVALVNALEATQPSSAVFAVQVAAHQAAVRAAFATLPDDVWAYGATAKGNTLVALNALGPHLTGVVDSTPAKAGKYFHGKPILAEAALGEEWPKAFFLTAWNWREPILTKLKARGFRGPVLVPFPVPHTVVL